MVKEQENRLSLIDFAFDVLQKENQPITFETIVANIEESRPFAAGDKQDQLARLYTNINLDQRFIEIGEGFWSLRAWYPFDKKVANIEVPKGK